MTAFRDGVGRLASQTERNILTLYRRHLRGEITERRFVALAATVLASARAKGVSLADLVLTAAVMRALGEATAPIGITPPPEDSERLQESVRTVLEADVDSAVTPAEQRESVTKRLARLGRDAPVEAAVWAMSVGGSERGIRGWVRETDIDPCPVCIGLADGVARPFSVLMKRHTGCACVPQPAF